MQTTIAHTMETDMPKAKPARSYVTTTMASPVGTLTLVGSDRGLAAVLWENDDPRRVRLNIVGDDRNHPVLVETERQLAEYFAGRRTAFSVRLDFAGTAFQNKVWQALLTIPFGETRSYGEIAQQIGNPKAVRAVGAANGRNPISIIAPCHRVVGATGELTGFAGGLETKAYLLKLERGWSEKPCKTPYGRATARTPASIATAATARLEASDKFDTNVT